MIFRGLICNNDADYNGKNNALYNAIKGMTIVDEEGNESLLCTSSAYSGRNGKADIYTIDDKPILVEPKQVQFKNEAMKLPLNFTDLDSSIIKREEI
jgi:hypothetical protein